MEDIIIFHTNDLHSHLENWPKIRRYLTLQKKKYTEAGKTVLTVDLGDFIDRWHPLTEATDGQANIALMNEVDYDAATIGNNEGVGNSKEQLNQLYDHADFPVLLGNLFDLTTHQAPAWTSSYKIIETKEQTKIGLIALTAPFPLTYAPNGWEIRSIKEVLPQLIREVQPKCDILVLMSHLGIDEDLKIANAFPEINVLLGSHTHHLFKYGEKINGTQLSAAGKFGNYIGEVQLSVDKGQIIQSGAKAIATAELPTLVQDQKEIDDYLTLGHHLLKTKKIAKIPHSLLSDLNAEHPLMVTALKALKEKGQTEVAILNNGLFLTDIPKGIVNADQLHEALPHPMHLIRVTLSGHDLVRMVKEMEKNRDYLRKFPIMGMGFRGKVFGELYYDGLAYNKQKEEVLWNHRPIELESNYTFTTIDHFMFIPFFPTIELAGSVDFIFPEFLRTVLGNYLKTHYPIL
ncbi:multifunctional 2',3'-cyclic-nucleotide 2'-phosphodiesterase/5'-nucleotidase/3'-nucleotidase [Enterococcus ureilyticus]|uniref:Multifunctional 2',3'-cyclic-nucleotide 2'-phosphodiesterase/5'-nucleotidase/3'-nucleotidase n=1 Tax=Enterococcus ureilyticus TaxID=1131292 RepID=A0A1E5HGF4_9ENTE|nr:bifunctional metallophosphatase/5'-nucleotidase [Enterococcus ureilyticus]MBM7688060.1 2',3'-cyclic-nucleotide 2'-phosphodiesterase (5'-nucleotidase family) [Enterococcus ureilyticus]MBO0447838.1 5'-nucleotidase C-terminal domain-containing protein [Enterococcus ureilyticus]OEG23875.1 multifunctional 2',3'-cyclic-nucleotide 2'-phosphodiesterase/5'-nucleotidase/3'-nucleotidase [Enterococcus ureilyticus]